MDKVYGIYNIEPIQNTNKIIIKLISKERVTDNGTINDSLLDKFDIMKNIHAELFNCNIVDSYLYINKTLPMFYINVLYSRPLRHVLMMKLLLYVNVETRVITDRPLDCNFVLELNIEDKKIVLDKFTDFPGKEELLKKCKDFIESDYSKEILIKQKNMVDIEWAKLYPFECDDKIPKATVSLMNYDSDDNSNDDE